MAEPIPAAPTAAPKPRWVLGIVAGLVGGLLGALVHAAIIANTDQGLEIRPLAILIGVLAAIGLVKVGKITGLTAALLAGLIGGIGWVFAYIFGGAWFIAEAGYGTVFSNFGELVPETWNLVKAYFEIDSGYIGMILAIGGGLVTGLLLNRKK